MQIKQAPNNRELKHSLETKNIINIKKKNLKDKEKSQKKRMKYITKNKQKMRTICEKN